jgi:heme/copper-type cytochrome/quinol oxidase subunit 3
VVTVVNVADLTRMRWLLGTLLIAAAALFAIGVATEGDAHHRTITSVESGEHNEATEQAEHKERAEATETGETILGVNLESTPLVVLAVISSVALAAATWRTDRKLILLVTALFAAAFSVLDVAEFSHQLRESATMIAAVAAMIAVLHAAAAFLAEQRRATRP